MMFRLVLTALAFGAAVCAADSTVAQTSAKMEEQVAKAPAPTAMEYRLRAAQALRTGYPELSRKFLEAALESLRGKDAVAGPAVWQVLTEVAPAESVALASQLGPAATQMAITMLARTDHMEEATGLYQKTAASFTEPLSYANALWLLNASCPVAKALPDVVAENYERVIRAAAAPDFGRDAKVQMMGTIQVGKASITTDNSRDTLLILAGARLRMLAPERFSKYQETFAKWDLTGPAMLRGTGPAAPPEVAAISKRMGTMRGLPSDRDRTQLVKELVPEIRKLPLPSRLGLIRSLAGVATEGDLGKEALGMVAVTLAEALREAPASNGDSYLELAKLVRYEHLTVPGDATLDAAQTLLALRERVQQENGFSVTSLDGKTYTLAGLKGKIVLLNFWATWCPPCRKEMPDMEKLYRTYEKQGLTVIAVSDEYRETVVNFLAKNNYSFPIALDPGRKVNSAFAVDGIPKSFIFDREGRLAAQAIDMRTEGQFMELLRAAGLE
jgi:peroxiredoxin